MKFIYGVLVIALIGASSYLYVSMQHKNNDTQSEVPEGYHKMEDGTLMKNIDGVTEGTFMYEEETLLDSESEKVETESDHSSQATVTLDPNARVFTVTGINHAFDIEEIRVQKGDTVTINFESTDGFHDWVVDEFNAATTKVQPGVPTSVTFVADTEGVFEYYCSVGNHRAKGMVGNLIVEG